MSISHMANCQKCSSGLLALRAGYLRTTQFLETYPMIKQVIFLTLASGMHIALAQNAVPAKPATAPDAVFKCTSTPCGNTATGEDPSEIAERNGEKILKEIREKATDRQRWGITILYSSDKDAAGPKLDIIKDIGFSARLQPRTGQLTFEKNGIKHAFSIGGVPGAPNDMCPRYAIAVVDASAEHAVIKRSCFQYEYKPKRFYKSVDFYIYDIPAASMRNIWTAATEDTALAGAMVSPHPALKATKNGYLLDWTVTDISKSATEKYKVKMLYERKIEKANKSPSLVCTDLTAPKGENVEAGACEGDHLELLPK